MYIFRQRDRSDSHNHPNTPSSRSAARAKRRVIRNTGSRYPSDAFPAPREEVLEFGARTLGFEERSLPPPPLRRESSVQLDYTPIPGYTAPPTRREYFRFRRPRNAWSEGSCFRDRNFERTRKNKIDALITRGASDKEIEKEIKEFDTSVNNRNLAQKMWESDGFTSIISPSRPRTARGTRKKKLKAKAKKVRFSRTRRPRRSRRARRSRRSRSIRRPRTNRKRRIRERIPTPYIRSKNRSASSITFSPTDVPTPI